MVVDTNGKFACSTLWAIDTDGHAVGYLIACVDAGIWWGRLSCNNGTKTIELLLYFGG